MLTILNYLKSVGFEFKTLTTAYTAKNIIANDGELTKKLPYKINDTCIYLMLCEIRKWFIDHHQIEILVYCNASGWMWELNKAASVDSWSGGTQICWSDNKGPNESGCWDSEEIALQDGIKAAVEYIKKM